VFQSLRMQLKLKGELVRHLARRGPAGGGAAAAAAAAAEVGGEDEAEGGVEALLRAENEALRRAAEAPLACNPEFRRLAAENVHLLLELKARSREREREEGEARGRMMDTLGEILKGREGSVRLLLELKARARDIKWGWRRPLFISI
jgi:hypothetical protein